MRGIIGVGIFICTSVNADVWPFFHQNVQRTGLSPYKGADCCDIECSTDTMGSKASPVIDDNGYLYIPALKVGAGDYYVWCINTVDCSVKWKCVLGQGQVPANIGSSCAISPIDYTIYVGYKSALYAINQDSTLKWSYSTGDGIQSSPVVDSNGIIYAGCNDTYLYAIKSDGTLEWSYKTGGSIISSPAIGYDGTIYMGSNDQKLYAINSNGTLRWSYLTGGGIESSPAVSSDGVIYVGSGDSYLYAIKSDGTLKWRYSTGGNVQSSPAVDNGRSVIFVGNNNSKIFAIDTTGGLIWQTSLSGSVGYSSPAIADVNNMVYIGDKAGTFYVIEGWTGNIVCSTSHSFFVTSPVVDKSDSTKWCVWYTSYDDGVYKNCCLSPAGVEENSKFKISPNPFTQKTVIEFKSLGVSELKELQLQIYDLSGKLVEETNSNIVGEKLQPGIYFIGARGYEPMKIVKLGRVK